MKYLHTTLLLLLSVLLVGCYNDFDTPTPTEIYTDDDFTQAGEQIISIKELKQYFYTKWGSGSNGLARRVEITDDVVIKGKVISSDEAGNVYNSMYIYDGEQAIEIRMGSDNYINYPQGQVVYVRAKGLSLASYRYMLSLGCAPEVDADGKFANDDANTHDTSASGNTTIPTSELIRKYVFKGARETLSDDDIVYVTADNYKSVLNDNLLGRLVHFEGLRSAYTTVNSNIYPSYLENINGTYTNKYYQDEGLPVTWAYNYDSTKYYGSALFTYETTPSSLESGSYVARVSGYADFALQPLPADNATVSLTAIYTKYCSSSGGYIAYQLVINSFSDIEE